MYVFTVMVSFNTANNCVQSAAAYMMVSIKIMISTSCSVVGGGGHIYANRHPEWDPHS